MFGLFLNLFPENIIGVSLVLDIFLQSWNMIQHRMKDISMYVNSLKFRNRSVILPSAYEFQNV